MTLPAGKKYFYLLSFALALIFSVTVQSVYIAAGFSLLVIVWSVAGREKYVMPVTVFLLLATSSSVIHGYRNYVNIAAMLVSLSLFIKTYGLGYRKYPRLPSEPLLFMAGFLTVMGFSTLFSSHFIIGITFIGKQLFFFSLLYFAYADIIERKNIKDYVFSLIAVGSLIAVTILWSFFSSDTAVYLLETEGYVRQGGIYANVAASGAILLVSISILIGYIFSGKLSGSEKSWLALLLFLQVAGILLTNSRAALGGLFVSVVIISWFLNRKALWYILGGAAIALVLFFISFPEFWELLLKYFRVERIFENERYRLWGISADIIKNDPLTGAGPGQFKFFMYKYNPTLLGSWAEVQMRYIYEYAGLGHSHNFLLFLFSELGIFGLIAAISLVWLFYRYGKLAYLNASGYTFLVIALIAAGSGIFARSSFESTGILTYGWISRDLPFWIAFIILIVFAERVEPPRRKGKP